MVKVINVGYNKDEVNEILERSEKLKGYSILLSYIKEARSEGYNQTEAIDIAIRRCMRDGILTDFLSKNSAEVGSMLFDDITIEEFIELRAEEQVRLKAKDMAEDMAKDMAEDMAKDMAEDMAKDMAKKMKAKGVSVEDIAEITNLSPEIINQL